MKRGKVILAAVLGLATLGANSVGYHFFKKVALPGAGGWDYLTVDEAARRLYVSHATQVVVLDADSLEIVGKIPNLSGVHGIAVAPEFGRGFVTAGQMDAVIVFDLKTLAKLGEPVMSGPFRAHVHPHRRASARTRRQRGSAGDAAPSSAGFPQRASRCRSCGLDRVSARQGR